MKRKKRREKMFIYILIFLVSTIFSMISLNGANGKSVQALETQSNINSIEKTPIMGTGSLSRGKMLQILYNNNKIKNLSELGNFVDYTINESNIEGVNYDIAFSQMMLETSYLNFGADVKIEQNNFGGIGATGNGVAGDSFPSVNIGIRAVIQHLKAYASTASLNQTCVDPRFKYVKRGCIPYVEYLGIKENPDGYGWATDEGYGTKIKNVFAQISAQKVSLSQISGVNVNSLMKVGKPVTIDATATPNEDSLYRIWIKDNGDWKIISDYSSNSKVSYIPVHDGQYAVEVDVKNKYSDKNYDDVWSKLLYINKPDLPKANASLTGVMKIGKPVTIEATSTPSEDSLYRIWIKDNGDWKIISDYSSNSKVSYIPIHDGQYAVQVDVKNKYSNKNYDDAWSKLFYVDKPDSPKIISSDLSGTMKALMPITVNIAATPNEDSLYRIWIKDNGDWKVISNYSTTNKIDYIPQHGGNYAVEVDVKNKYSSNAYDTVWSKLFTVTDDNVSKLISTDVSGDMKVGNLISISATATPKEDTLYRIWIKDNGDWKVISDYSSVSKVNYIPSHQGLYAVQIDVKHKNSSNNYDDVYSKLFTVAGNGEVKIDKVDVSGMINMGKTMTISAKATVTEGTLYRIWIKENGNWNLISDYSTNSVVSYTPKFKGPYAIQVDVKNASSTNNYDDVWCQFVYTKQKDITIVLDPGHGLDGGKFDPGAESTFSGVLYRESQLNLRIAQKAYRELVNRGYNVIMTRTAESNGQNFLDRPMYANNSIADLYISIHQNSFSASSNGTEVLYSSKIMDEEIRQEVISAGLQDPTITNSSKVSESANLANILVNNLAVSTGFSNRGAKDQSLYVCRNTYMPAVLIECGFISNADQASKLAQDGYQGTISKVVAISVDQYFNFQ